MFEILTLKNIPIICFLFLFIFTPLVMLPFNIIHILAIVSLIFLLSVYSKRFFQIIKLPELFVFITLTFFLTIYTIALNSLSTKNFGSTYYAASTILEVLPCAIFISFVFLEHKIDLNKFYDIILLIGMLQVTCVILTMIFPGLREWIIANSGSEGLEDAYEAVKLFRMYGWARGFTFSMPLFQGLCVIIAFVLGTYKSSKYYLLIPFFIVSIAVNARIALICLFIVPCVVFFFRFKMHPIKQIFSISFVFLALFFMVQMIQYMAEYSSSYDIWFWLNQGIKEIISFKEGEATGNLYALTDKMWFMPNGIYELIFGTGENVFGRSYMSSDIGYIVNLYYGGLVFSIVLYLSYFILLIKYYGNNIIEKNISVSIILYLFIANLKGNVFKPNEVINGVLLLIVFSIAFRKFYQTRITDIHDASS